MVTIQATTIGGSIIDKARWEVPSINSVQVGHTLSICLNSDDKNLLTHIRKQEKTECSLDRAEDGKYTIVVTLVVKQVRHMLDASKFDTMCIVVPMSRHVEQVILYLLDPSQCDKRFAGIVRQG